MLRDKFAKKEDLKKHKYFFNAFVNYNKRNESQVSGLLLVGKLDTNILYAIPTYRLTENGLDCIIEEMHSVQYKKGEIYDGEYKWEKIYEGNKSNIGIINKIHNEHE